MSESNFLTQQIEIVMRQQLLITEVVIHLLKNEKCCSIPNYFNIQGCTFNDFKFKNESVSQKYSCRCVMKMYIFENRSKGCWCNAG